MTGFIESWTWSSAQRVARWRKRFLALGMLGLDKDAPRPGRTLSISAAKVKRVIQKTTQEKPDHRTHWSTRSMASAVALSEATGRRIWHKNGLKPHLVETFKVSTDPHFAVANAREIAPLLRGTEGTRIANRED
jgi:hypothetical protein